MYPGPVHFKSVESVGQLERMRLQEWPDNDLDTSLIPSKNVPKGKRAEEVEDPQGYDWEDFFEECSIARREYKIQENDLVFLITDRRNYLNWFGGVSPSRTNYFVQSSHWNLFFGADLDKRFPVAYEIAIWLIRYLMFDRREDILEATHKQPRGCANDFCQDKQEIILKMRTGDLCNSCMQILHQRNVSPLIANQLFSIMDGIRAHMMFRERSKLLRKPSRVEVRGITKRIFLTDLGDLELNFNPKERTIYLFYLAHPEGIRLPELQDYRQEIMGYYQCITHQDAPEQIHRAVDLLLNPAENNIHEVLSRIKLKLKNAVGPDLLEYYNIMGISGEVKRISLNREFVSYKK
jgi:hypothetical protein